MPEALQDDRTRAVWQRARSLAREKGPKDDAQVPVEGLQQGQGEEGPLLSAVAVLLLGGQPVLLLSSSGSSQHLQPHLTCPAPPLLWARANLGLAVPNTFQILTSQDSCSEGLC